MSLSPLGSILLILRPQAWLHCRHYDQVLSPIRWWGWIPWLLYLVSLLAGYIGRRRLPLDPVLQPLVSTRVAQLCYCEFYIDITSITLATRSGSQDKLLAVVGWRNSAPFDEKERLALAYAEAAIWMPPEVDDVLCSAMIIYFDARALTELTVLTDLQNLSVQFSATMAIPARGLCQMSTFSSQSKE